MEVWLNEMKGELFYWSYATCELDAVGGVGASDEVRGFRLALTKGVGEVLKSGLGLLGIKAPEKM